MRRHAFWKDLALIWKMVPEGRIREQEDPFIGCGTRSETDH